MTQLFQRRGLFPCRAFSLVELLITFVIIGIITALLIPNLLQARQEALRQTVRQQAKSLETALGNWFASQPNLVTASATWNTYATAAGYIQNTAFLTTTGLGPFMSDKNQMPLKNTNSTGLSPGPIITTAEMRQVTATSGGAFIGGSIAGLNNAYPTANVLLYWVPKFRDPDPTVSTRSNTSPKVLLFLPDIP